LPALFSHPLKRPRPRPRVHRASCPAQVPKPFLMGNDLGEVWGTLGELATGPGNKGFSQGGIEPPGHETSSVPRGCRHDGASRCPAPFTSRGSVILFADQTHNEHVDASCLHPSKWWQRFPFQCLFVTGRLTSVRLTMAAQECGPHQGGRGCGRCEEGRQAASCNGQVRLGEAQGGRRATDSACEQRKRNGGTGRRARET